MMNSQCLIKWSAILLWTAIAIQCLLFANDALFGQIASAPMISYADDSPSPIIILMGLPRSGSKAIHDYFECHGLRSRHYCCDNSDHDDTPRTSFPCSSQTCGDCVLGNLKESSNRRAFDGCSDFGENAETQIWSAFDVETDKGWFLPQHFALGLLHEQYPNAVWILNTRQDSYDWAMSIFHWHSMTRRFLYSFGFEDGIEQEEPRSIEKPSVKAKIKAEDVQMDLEKSVTRIQSNLQARRERIVPMLQEIYLNHTRTIQQWALQFPSHQLLQVNVDEDDVSSIRSQLEIALGRLHHHESNRKCDWNYQAPDNDWKNFALPY